MAAAALPSSPKTTETKKTTRKVARVSYCFVVDHESVRATFLPHDDDKKLEKLKALVGGYIEPIYSPDWPNSIIMVANEEGIIENLPWNGLAPLVAGILGCNVLGFCHATSPGYLRGPIVFCKEVDGDFAGFSSAERDALAPMFEYARDNDEAPDGFTIPKSLVKPTAQ